MDRILPTKINQNKTTKKLCIFMVIFCLAPILLNIFCLSPIYQILFNNATYKTTVLPEIIHYVRDFFDVLAFSSAYALLIFSFILLPKKASVFVTISYLGILILKIPLTLLVEQLLNHSIITKNNLLENLMYQGVYFLLEILQFFIVFFIVRSVAKNYLRSIDFLKSKKNLKSNKIKQILPIKELTNKYNPLLRSALYSGIVVTGFRVLVQLIADIDLGAPNSFAVTLIMLILYATAIIYGALSYLISIPVYNLFYKFLISEKKNKKDKADEKHSSALPSNDSDNSENSEKPEDSTTSENTEESEDSDLLT